MYSIFSHNNYPTKKHFQSAFARNTRIVANKIPKSNVRIKHIYIPVCGNI